MPPPILLNKIDSLVDSVFRLARSTDQPPRRHRVVVALVIATIAATFPYIRYLGDPTHPADFSQAWFGARALLHHADPYVLVGPGRVYDWDWQLFYPATSMVAAMPLAFLPQLAAAIAFVWISSFVLAYAVTVTGWFRLVMFFTPAFALAAGAAQWSPLLTAALILPMLGLVLAAKPNIGLAFFVAGSTRLRYAALIGGFVLVAVSLALLPSWPAEWLGAVRSTPEMGAPMLRLGGFVILLTLLRWRRPECWLIVALACVPQTTYWYEALPLFLVPVSLIEVLALAAALSLGALLEHMFIVTQNRVLYNEQIGALLIAFAYLPAMLLVLRRPNERVRAPWLRRADDVPENIS